MCRDINDQLYAGSPPNNSVPKFTNPITDRLYPAVTGYPSGPGWDACTGLGVIDGGALLGALEGVFAKDCQFILDRTEIGEDEVEETVTTSQPGLISSAFYVVVDGFNAAALGIVASDLTGTPSHNPTFTVSVAGMTVVPTSRWRKTCRCRRRLNDSPGNARLSLTLPKILRFHSRRCPLRSRLRRPLRA